ncbi:MAG: gliding motility-associated ABC transporter substrate-binding protein GldG [Flavobacteriales bacterium]
MTMKARRTDLFNLFLSIGILFFLAFILTFVFFKLDLTEEKRHTLTEPTKEMLGSLEDKVFVRCYLTGEFPAGFKRLEQNIKERLDEFRDYSSSQIEYEFIDPYSSGDKKTIEETENALYEKGLRFTRLSYEENGAQQSKLIWPGAIIEYRGKEYPVQFFKSDMPEPSDEMINSSVNSLEFELASNLRKALRKDKPAVAIIQGHGELLPIEMADYLNGLEQNYAIDIVTIDERINALSDKVESLPQRKNLYDAIIIAKPDSAFSDKDRVIIDQYIMNGGKVLWMVDPVLTDLDSLRAQQQTMGVSNEMGLYEMLFEYGARINRNIVIDFQAAPIAFDAGPMGNQRNIQMFSWYYSPLLFPPANAHPIVANLDPIKYEFASSIDTVNSSPLVKKIPILRSSELSKALKTPVRINTSVVELGMDYFKQGAMPNQIMALMMEGQFNSAFKDQLPLAIRQDPVIAYKESSVPTAMMVIADGDVVRNAVMETPQGPVPQALGFDRYAKRVIYDNKEFLLNSMNYLLDDKALISVRSRTIKLRKLDDSVVAANRTRIQVENAALPIFVLLIIGGIQVYIRKKKWTKK